MVFVNVMNLRKFFPFAAGVFSCLNVWGQDFPAFIAQPASQSAALGATVAFDVSATGGAEPLSYQWQANGTNLVDGSLPGQAVVSGAAGNALTLTGITTNEQANYTCVISNGFGSITSAPAALVVILPPSIVTSPASTNCAVGTTVLFAVSAQGTAPLNFQWRKDGNDINGANLSTYTLANAQMGDSGNYACHVSNPAGGATSSSATLMVGIAPTIDTNPQTVTAPLATDVSFTVTASGFPLAYQWWRDGTPISGANGPILTLTAITTNEVASTYYVTASNFLGTATSATVGIIQSRLPYIITEPVGKSVVLGSNFTVTVTASGPSPLYYQWIKDGTNLPGATSASLSVANAQAANSGNYWVLVTNNYGAVTSSVALITVMIPPNFTQQPTSQNATIGTTITLKATAVGIDPLSYQWRKDGMNIPNANMSTYTIGNAQPADSGVYSVFASNPAGQGTSSNAVVMIGVAPVITTQPQTATAVTGQTATFTAGVSGTPLVLQWRRNGVAITGATNAILTLTGVTSTDASYGYSLLASNFLGTATSFSVGINLVTAPTISSQPQGRSVMAGSNVTFSVTATGTGTIYYQWRKTGSNLTGATLSYLNFVSAQLTNSGDYTVVITNLYGAATSSVATLEVLAAPFISSQPQSRVITNIGATFFLGATAFGSDPMSYQWLKGGNDIPGANNSLFIVGNAQTNDSGVYCLRVTNPAGVSTSSNAVVSVGLTPAITVQPTTVYAGYGQNVTFAVVATGTPLAYYWRKGGTIISGATNSTLTLSNIASSDATFYTVTVSNFLGNVTSFTAYIYGGSAPTITGQPFSQAVGVGFNLTLSVTASGTSTFYYQWRKNGTPILGAISPTYSMLNLTATNSGSYSVAVTNLYGQTVSSNAVITVLVPPVFSVQPQGQNTSIGATVAFSTLVSGMDPLSYQWRKNGVDIPDANYNNFALYNVQTTDSGIYTLYVSNPAGAILSTNAVLNVGSAPVITVHPSTTIGVLGQNVTYRVTATGTPLYYQWRRSGVAIAGATNSTFTLTNIASTDANYSYFVVVSNFLATATSLSANLTIVSLPSITSQPQSQMVGAGSNFNVSVTATGSGTLYYRWFKDDSILTGVISPTFSIAKAQSTNAGNYTVVVTNLYGAATSSVAAITVLAPPVFTAQPASRAVAPGATTSFSATVTGMSPLSLQWRKDGVNIPGAIYPSYSLDNAQTNDAGIYTLYASNPAGSAISTNAELRVGQLPVITSQPQSTQNTPSDTVQFTVSATGTGLNYSWQKNSATIPNATNSILTLSNVSFVDIASYRVVVFNPIGSVTSAPATLTLPVPPTITIPPQDVLAVAGNPATLDVTGTGAPVLQYQWYKQPGIIVPAAATNTVLGGFLLGITVTNGGNGYETAPQVDIVGGGGHGATATATVANGVVTGITVVTPGSGYTNSPAILISPVPLALGWTSSSPLSFPNVDTNNAGSYFVVVANDYGSVTSSVANLSVILPVSIIAEPQDVAVATGTPASFSVVAGGTGPFTYQWFDLPSNHSTALATPLLWNGYVYCAVVTNGGYGYATAPKVTIIGDGVGAQASAVVSNGIVTDIVITDPGAGYSSLTAIQIDPPPAATLAGQTNASLFIANVTTNDVGLYWVQVANIAGSVLSRQASLIVQLPLSLFIINQPISRSVITGSSAALLVGASGTGPIHFQWQKDGASLLGCTQSVYAVSSATTNDTGNYFVIVTNVTGAVTSTVATLTVGIPPQNLQVIATGGSAILIHMQGTPYYPYVLESATNLTPPANWQPVLTNAADTNGVWQFTDTNLNSSQKFYRSVGQ